MLLAWLEGYMVLTWLEGDMALTWLEGDMVMELLNNLKMRVWMLSKKRERGGHLG
jgi:hypothetical protein